MAGPDLDAVIRKLAKAQNKSLMAAAKAGRDRYLGLAARTGDAEAKQRHKQMAKHAMEEGTAAAKRLQMSADNAADSYSRAMRRAADVLASQKATTPVAKKTPAKKMVKAKPGKTKPVKRKTA